MSSKKYACPSARKMQPPDTTLSVWFDKGPAKTGASFFPPCFHFTCFQGIPAFTVPGAEKPRPALQAIQKFPSSGETAESR